MWKDKAVIITGSSVGIGYNLAREIAKKSGKVVLNARNSERLEFAKTQLKSEGFDVTSCAGDISKYEDCDKLVNHSLSKFGKIDVLINNAGIASQGTLEEISPDVFKKVVDINYLGSVYMTKATIPFIKETKGSIMYLGSLAGIHGLGAFAAYSGTKMALRALVESLKIELHDTGIHVGIAYVGFTENDPGKTFLNKDGVETPLPSREKMKQEPADKVARRIMKMVEKRKSFSTFTTLGKLNACVNRIAPGLVQKILLNAYKKGDN